MIPRIDVTVAAVIEHDDRYLLVEERVADRLVFNQPAGHLEPGESLLEAVVREVGEETGYVFTPEALVGVYLWQCDGADHSFLRVCFTGGATPPSSEPTLDTGIVAAHWLTREQLLNPKRELRSPLVLRCIEDFREGARFPLSCLRHLAPERAGDLRTG